MIIRVREHRNESAEDALKDIYYGKIPDAMNSIKKYLNYIEDVIIRKGTADWDDVGSLNSLSTHLEEWGKWADEQLEVYKK